MLRDFEAGAVVDVRDSEMIWCEARVELKLSMSGNRTALYIHFLGWSRKYDEYVWADSHRIAPKGIYTKRTDIPRYHVCRVTGRVMLDNNDSHAFRGEIDSLILEMLDERGSSRPSA